MKSRVLTLYQTSRFWEQAPLIFQMRGCMFQRFAVYKGYFKIGYRICPITDKNSPIIFPTSYTSEDGGTWRPWKDMGFILSSGGVRLLTLDGSDDLLTKFLQDRSIHSINFGPLAANLKDAFPRFDIINGWTVPLSNIQTHGQTVTQYFDILAEVQKGPDKKNTNIFNFKKKP